MKSWFFFCLFFLKGIFAFTHYPLLPEPIDVIIPCHVKDVKTLDLCIEGIRKNGKNIGRIIVVSEKKMTEKAEWFDEKNYPFSLQDLKKELFKNTSYEINKQYSRLGWILQQLLKLYAFKVIPGLSSNLLVLDADTIFLRPTKFLNEKGEPYFNLGKERHPPYFAHFARLLPHVEPQKRSGISHHMIFQKPILEDLFYEIEKEHQEEPWKAICHCVGKNDIFGSGFSEYETYFSFALAKTKQAHPRKLKWKEAKSLEKLSDYKRRKFAYISCHTSG